VFIAVHQGLWGVYMGCSFAPNHKGMPTVTDDDSLDFLRKQVLTSGNVGHPGFVGDLIWREDQVMARKSPYSAELRRRAVVMVADVRSEYDTEFAAITSVAKQLGVGSAETLRKWVRQAEIDAGKRRGTTREEAAEIGALKRRVAELERANEILKAASSYFARELDFTL
jgi:transposase